MNTGVASGRKAGRSNKGRVHSTLACASGFLDVPVEVLVPAEAIEKAKHPTLSGQARELVGAVPQVGLEPTTDGLLICCWIIAFVRVAVRLSSIGVLSTVDVPIHGDDRHDESHEYESPFSTQSSTPLAICS